MWTRLHLELDTDAFQTAPVELVLDASEQMAAGNELQSDKSSVLFS